MTETATGQLNRIVQLIADLSRREREGKPPLRIGEIASAMGVSERQIEKDIRTVTSVGDDAEHDWIGSLSVVQEGDEIALSSRGHFRRPVRLTPDELLAIQAGLLGEDGGAPLSQQLARLLEEAPEAAASLSATPYAGPDESSTLELAREAASRRRCLEIVYAGLRGEPARRVIEVHAVVGHEGKFYLRSWCRTSDGERSFRADRVLEARLLDERFDGRPLDPDTVFNAPPEVREQVRVRFHPGIARWIAEEYPWAEPDGQGGVMVTYEVTEPAWLIRTVLGYGEHAEVVGPPEYRELIRRATLMKAS